MECVADGQGIHGDIAFFKLLNGVLDPVGRAGDHRLTRTVLVRGDDVAIHLAEHFLHDLIAGSNTRHLSWIIQFDRSHFATARGDR